MWARKLIKPSLNQAVLLTRNFVTTAAMQTSSKLSGKVAIVTASTDGIGFEIARKLAQDGAKVVISSRKREHVDRAVATLSKEGLTVTGTVCHVGKAADRENLFKHAAEKFQGIDILVSNAAVNPHFGSTLDCSEEQWDKIFEINVKAAFLLTKAAVPHMEKRGGGSIVYVGSIAGLAPFEVLGPYSISKTAILGLTKVIAKECGDKNIRVNCIAPGIIQTNFSSALWSNDTSKEQMEMTTALKRLGQPRECSGLVSFLCSDDASYITGETIVVSGGLQSRL